MKVKTCANTSPCLSSSTSTTTTYSSVLVSLVNYIPIRDFAFRHLYTIPSCSTVTCKEATWATTSPPKESYNDFIFLTPTDESRKLSATVLFANEKDLRKPNKNTP